MRRLEDWTMELILWRHADAEDGTPDAERKLTAKGMKQGKRMAKWLKSRLPEDTVIMASPAKRALQTVRTLTADFRVVTEIGTSGTAESLLTAIGWPKANGSVLVVGHQPTLGETAALLLTGGKEQWELKKGAIIWLFLSENHAMPRVLLRAAISPDLL
jgi:phosphohistidine phosphatase